MQTDHVGAGRIGIADRDAPDGPAGDEIAAQGGVFEIDAFRREGIAVAQIGDGGEQAMFGAAENCHTFTVQRCTLDV